VQLIVGNVSTWSMRAWICLKLANLDFEEVVVSLDVDNYKIKLSRISNSMLVPVLKVDELLIHDSLAIAEYANEVSDGALFPLQTSHRALARSLCSELHAGFTNVRSTYPFSWEASPVDSIAKEVESEIRRLTDIWSQAAGSFYFQKASVVDAYYSVLAYRLSQYGIVLEGSAGEYQRSLIEWPLFNSCIEQAKNWVKSVNVA